MSGKKQKEKKEKKKTKGFKASASKIADEAERANENLEQANETLRVVAGVAQEVQGQVHELQQQVHDGAQAARNQVDALNERVDGVQGTVDSLLETMQDVTDLLQQGMERAELTAAQTNEYARRLELITKLQVVKGELHANQLKTMNLEFKKLKNMLLTGAGGSLELAVCALVEASFATAAVGLAAGTPVVAGGLGYATVAGIAAGTLALPGVAAIGGCAAVWGGLCKLYYDERDRIINNPFGRTRSVMSKTGRNLDKIEHEFEKKFEERRSCREHNKNLHDDIKCQLGMVPVSQHQLAH